MASNTAFPSPVNSEGWPLCKAQQEVKVGLEAPAPPHPQPDQDPQPGPFPWNLFLEKQTQKLFITSSLSYRAVSFWI